MLRGNQWRPGLAGALAQIRAVMTTTVLFSASTGQRYYCVGICTESTHTQSTTDEVIHLTACEPLLEKRWYQLSGGEQQRVHLARARIPSLSAASPSSVITG